MLPKKIYVWQEEDDDTPYFMADTELPEDDGIKIGIYQLLETKIVKVSITLK